MNNLLVMKFGGTSMGSSERMRAAAAIIAAQQSQRPLVVVVSAMSKVTDLLLETLRRAELGDRAAVDSNIATLLDRHVVACQELLSEPAATAFFSDAAHAAIQSLVLEFRRIADGVLMLGERPPDPLTRPWPLASGCLLLCSHTF